MKNFPHQINQIPKLVAALAVAKDILVQGQDFSDDGVFGYALAKRGVYTFREKDRPIDDIIEDEQQKPTPNQGPRTCARDLRRLFTLLGFLDADPNGGYRITNLGNEIIAAGFDLSKSYVRATWRGALDNLVLTEAGQVSHPYQVLKRLARLRPGIESLKLSLALEAENDTAAELDRIVELADKEDWIQILEENGSSVHQIRNAVKILPALARQIGDLGDQNNNSSPADGAIAEVEATTHPSQSKPARRHRSVTAESIAQTGEPTDEGLPVMTDLTEANTIRKHRTARHHQLVQQFALLLQQQGYHLMEDPFDILGVHANVHPILVEVKTLDGSTDDEKTQVRGALGQLLYYEGLDVPAEARAKGIIKTAVFEKAVSYDHKILLRDHSCSVVYKEGDHFQGFDDLMSRLGF